MENILRDVSSKITVTTQVVRFKVNRFATFFIFLKIVDESTNGSTCSSGLLVDIFEFIGRYVLFIQGDREPTLNLSARSLTIS
jgi:hypothetical protein